MRIGILTILLSLLLSLEVSAQQPVVDIQFKVNGVQDTTCLLAYRFGKKVFVKDTIVVDKKGLGRIQYDKPLASGVYLWVLPDKNFIEFIVSDQKFSMETSLDDIVGKMQIENSSDNELFYQYRQFIDPKGSQIQEISQEIQALEADTLNDHKEEISEKQRQMNALNQEIVEFRENMMEKFPEAFITRMFYAMKEPEVPEAPILPNGRPDSTFAYRYFKEHYFDNISFQDSALLRTPIFEDKVKYYMEKLVIQIPDSVNKELDNLIAQAKGNQIMTEFLLKTFTSKYERSKLMGAENIFVHLVETYYDDEEYTPWLDSAQRERILKRGRQLSPILIGKKAPNLVMLDYYNKPQSLHNINADYTILYFWAFDCGHCKKITPKLKKYYEEVHDKGVEVFAVSTKQELEGWKKYVEENELPWINVHDLGGRNRIHDVYDIFSTPVIYLLDKDKKIIAKRLDIENLKKMIEMEMKKAN
jgi:thiol-disulfide isomerase/thioredoxin